MTFDPKDVRDLLIATYIANRHTYEDVAQLTGISLAEVGRAVGRIRKRIISRVDYGSEAMRAAVYDYMRDVEWENRLTEHFGTRQLPRVIVAPLAGAEDDEDRVMQRVAMLAAEQLLRYCEQAPPESHLKIGTSWGNSARRVIEAVGDVLPSEKRQGLPGRRTVFNTAGDIVTAVRSIGIPTETGNSDNGDDSKDWTSHEPLFFWSSALARDLAEVLNAELVYSYAPTWIPLEGLDHGNGSIEQQEADLRRRRQETIAAFSRYVGYNRIFGDDGLLANADVLLTGIGKPSAFHALLRSTTGLDHPFTAVAKSAEVVGDLSGVILMRGGVRHTPEVERFELTLLNATEKDFRQVADAARQEGSTRLGVIAVASGVEKAEAVAAAIAAELINVLVIDVALAEAIYNLKRR